MDRFARNITILSQMLILGIIPVYSLLIIAWSAYHVYQMDQVVQAVKMEYSELIDVEEVDIDLIEEEIAAKEYLLTGDKAFLEEHEAYKAAAGEFLEKAMNLPTERERSIVQRLSELRTEYEDHFSHVVEVHETGLRGVELQTYLEVVDETLEKIDREIENLLFYGELHLQEQGDKIKTLEKSAIYSSLVGLISFPLLVIAAFILVNRVTQPFITLSNAVIAMEGGKFRDDLLGGLLKRSDLFGAFARNLKAANQRLTRREAELLMELNVLEREIKETQRRKLVLTPNGPRQIDANEEGAK